MEPNVHQFIETFGLNHVGFLTPAFADDVQDVKGAVTGYQVGRIRRQTHDEATNAVMTQVVPTKYGNQVKVPSKIIQTANAAIIAGAVGSAASKAVDTYSEQSAGAVKQGNDPGAAHHAVMTAGATLENLPGVCGFFCC